MQYESELDGLRAIAIIGVVLFHLGFLSFAGGFSGVDVFFVLNGYLITAITVKDNIEKTFSFKQFYLNVPAVFYLPSLQLS